MIGPFQCFETMLVKYKCDDGISFKHLFKSLLPSYHALVVDQGVVTTIATIINHCGGNIDDVALSKSTARRHRQESRAVAAKEIKDAFECADICQINFKMLSYCQIWGLRSINRLVIVAVQEDCSQILAIAKTENGTGEVEAGLVAGALVEWDLVVSGFDTGVHKGGYVILHQLLERQIL